MSALHAAASERLDALGQRYTGRRRDLVELLAAQDRPGTIAEILSASTGMAQSSAYRNLATLESAGVVQRIVTDGDFARFELAEVVTGNHHHHLVCNSCGLVADVTMSPEVEASLESAVHEAATEEGFTPDGHRLDVLGLCASCR